MMEPLCFYDTDPEMRSFLYYPQTRQLWRVDFEHVGVFPISFASFGLYASNSRDIRDMAKRINFPRTGNLNGMDIAAARILIFSGNSLGT